MSEQTQTLASQLPSVAVAQFTTDRLLIRPPRAADAPTVLEAIVESLPELRSFPASLPWASAEPSITSTLAFCDKPDVYRAPLGDMPFLLFDRSTCFIGCVGLHRIDWSNRRFEIGFWLRTSKTGQGYATEAIRSLTRMAFDALKAVRVDALPDEANVASRRALEQSGYQLEGVLRKERLDPAGFARNTCVYSVVDDD